MQPQADRESKFQSDLFCVFRLELAPIFSSISLSSAALDATTYPWLPMSSPDDGKPRRRRRTLPQLPSATGQKAVATPTRESSADGELFNTCFACNHSCRLPQKASVPQTCPRLASVDNSPSLRDVHFKVCLKSHEHMTVQSVYASFMLRVWLSLHFHEPT